MELLPVASPADAAVTAAEVIARCGSEAIAARGRFRLALSGGSGVTALFRTLARQDLDWSAVELYQVDERVAPDGSQDRNLTGQREALAPILDRVATFVPMPVTAHDLDAAARRYGNTLVGVAGDPPVLDLVHLGIGPDGHTASLVPGDAVLAVTDRPVAMTGSYQGNRRMTLTYPVLDAARHRLWYVTGGDKRDVVRRFLGGDRSIPAARVRPSLSTLVVLSELVDT